MLGIKTKIFQFLQKRKKISADKSIRQLMKTFKADEYGHRASVEKADLGYGWLHYGFIRHLKPKRILCVGSRHGYIPAILAQACKDNGFGMVDFVDAGYGDENEKAWTGVGFWKTKKGRNIFPSFDLSRNITLFVMTTDRFAKENPNLVYDYIYIDGDHSYEGIRKDVALFEPKLNKQGFLVFHDVSVKGDRGEGEFGVWKIWKKFEKKTALTFNDSSSGLGIYQKK